MLTISQFSAKKSKTFVINNKAIIKIQYRLNNKWRGQYLSNLGETINVTLHLTFSKMATIKKVPRLIASE